MIYEVYLDGEILYYPDDELCAIMNSKLDQALNDSGTFEFDVPVTNPLYNSIENRRSMLQVLKNGKEIFYGEVRESEDNMDMTKHVYAVGELAFLFDSIQPQAKYQDQTPLQFFTTLLNNHNAQVEEKKQFKVGVVTVTDPNDSIYRFTNYEDTLTCLREKLCESLGGYLRIRKVDGVRYLDLVKLQDYGNTCEQPIQFGENLLDYAGNASSVDIATAVIPLGARLDESPIEGLDAYTDIKSVNDGKDYVYLPEAVSQFGWIKKVVHWDDVTEPANLKKKAEEWLKENQYELLTLEVNAVDLSMLDSNIDSFDLGDSVNAIAEPYGMDAWFPVQKMTTYLQEPAKNELVLSNTLKKSYTQQMASLTNQLDEKIPQQSAVLQAAKDNASELIKTATNGYIVLNMDDKGNPKELLIMDTKDIATAQKVWRWNINGLGYSRTGYNGEFGLAMTMDGAIVADFVTTGTMYADRIKGGTLKLGGYNNDNGVAEVRDASGKTLIRLDNKGITMADGTYISWNNIDGANDAVTKITKNTVTTAYVNALEVEAGSVAAEKITGSVINGKRLEGGSINIGGKFDVTGSGRVTINDALIDITTDDETCDNIILKYADIMTGIGCFGMLSSHGSDKAKLQFNEVSVTNGNAAAKLTSAGYVEASYGTIYGDLSVGGTKNRMVNTENFGEKLLYCYETSSPLFGDIGNAKTDETGMCIIFIDEIFSEAVNTTDCAYSVFLTSYGSGNLYVAERTASYFIVQGEPNTYFAWEIKAKQKEYELTRLETYQKEEVEPDLLTESADYVLDSGEKLLIESSNYIQEVIAI